MEKIYFYKVEYKIVQDHEELKNHQTFSQDNLFQARYLAFKHFEEISKIYNDQFLNPHPVIVSFISISLIQESDDYDFDYGLRIDFRRQDGHPLYRYSKGKIEKFIASFELENKIFESIAFTDKITRIDEVYNKSREIDIIHKIEAGINKSIPESEQNRSLNFCEVICYKCGKSMEVDRIISDKFNREKYRRTQYELKICCNVCIENFYKGALSVIKRGVYDKYGKSLNRDNPDLG